MQGGYHTETHARQAPAAPEVAVNEGQRLAILSLQLKVPGQQASLYRRELALHRGRGETVGWPGEGGDGSRPAQAAAAGTSTSAASEGC